MKVIHHFQLYLQWHMILLYDISLKYSLDLHFCTLGLCRGRDGWRSQCQFRENLRTPPSHDNIPNKPKNKIKSCKSCKTLPSHDNFPNKPKNKDKKVAKLGNPSLPRRFPKQTKKQNIEKMQNPALPRCFFDTLDTVDMVYTVYNIQIALHCLNSIMYAYI